MSPMICYQCQTIGRKSFEYLENLHTDRKQESKVDVAKGAESTSKFVMGDNDDEVHQG